MAFFCFFLFDLSSSTTLLARMLSHFSHVQLFLTLWIVAHRILCPWDSPGKNTAVVAKPPPGDLPIPGIKPVSLTSPALGGSFYR